MTDETQDEGAVSEIDSNDIVFECPHCSKSLAIDSRGVGLLITCPDCGEEIEVPGAETEEADGKEQAVEAPERIRVLSEALAASQSKIVRLVNNLEELRARRLYLEKLRAENMARLDRLTQEMTVIQAAMDRMVEILQDAKSDSIADEV